MKKLSFRGVLKAINNYLVFFLVVAFAVTCCMMLFASTLADTMGIVFDEENIHFFDLMQKRNQLLLHQQYFFL